MGPWKVRAQIAGMLLLLVILAGWGLPGATSTGPAAEITALPLPWPLTMPTAQQVQEARECDIEGLVAERYSGASTAESRESYLVETTCDWAVLAAAYALDAEADDNALHAGQLAWANAVSQNVAYAFVESLFFYLDMPDSVAPPSFTQDPLTNAEIYYSRSGLGPPHEVQWRVTIENADTAPEVIGIVDDQDYSAALNEELAQALGDALTGLLPVASSGTLVVCTDNSPDWTITLTYQNGERAWLANHGSNVYTLGGPWWVKVDDQLHLQTSATILTALFDIITALDLPIGEPRGMYCSGLESSLLDVLYPDS